MTDPAAESMSRRTLLKLAAATAAAPILTNAASVAASPAAKVMAAETTELEFLLIGGSAEMIEALENDLIPAFTSTEPAKINLQTTDWGSAFQKITTSVAAGLTPDVMTLGGIWVGPLASKEALLEIDEYVAAWPERDQFYEAYLKDCQYEGKTYALPIYSSTPTVAYRSDFFTEAGLDPAKPPATWDEYKEAATKLVQRDGDEITREGAHWMLDTSIGLQQAFAQVYLQAGGTYYKEDGKANFASPEGVKALTWLVSFFEDKLSSVNFVLQPGQPQFVVTGSAAMGYTWPSVYQQAQQQAADVVRMIQAALPLKATPDSQPVTSAWIGKYGIGARTKAPNMAWKWLAFLCSKRALEVQLPLMGFPAARKDLTDLPYLKGMDPDFLEAANYVVPQPAHPDMLQIVQVIKKELERAVRLESSPEDTLKAIDDGINEITGA